MGRAPLRQEVPRGEASPTDPSPSRLHSGRQQWLDGGPEGSGSHERHPRDDHGVPVKGPPGPKRSYFKLLLIRFDQQAAIDPQCDLTPVRKIDPDAIAIDGRGGQTNITAALQLALDRLRLQWVTRQSLVTRALGHGYDQTAISPIAQVARCVLTPMSPCGVMTVRVLLHGFEDWYNTAW